MGLSDGLRIVVVNDLSNRDAQRIVDREMAPDCEAAILRLHVTPDVYA